MRDGAIPSPSQKAASLLSWRGAFSIAAGVTCPVVRTHGDMTGDSSIGVVSVLVGACVPSEPLPRLEPSGQRVHGHGAAEPLHPHPHPGDSSLHGLRWYKCWNRIFQSRAGSNPLYLWEVVKELKIGLLIPACHDRG